MKFDLFVTDYYQLAMDYVYILEGKANEEVVFEAFVRKIKGEVNENGDYYIFMGRKEVEEYIGKIKEELKNNKKELLVEFKEVLYSGLSKEVRERYNDEFDKLWMELDIDFEYSIAEDLSIIKPIQPAFQYRGPRWIGQLIETRILNIINSRSGVGTNSNQKEILDILDNVDDNSFYRDYEVNLRLKAREYLNSTRKLLVEAGFRRSPNLKSAIMASKIAIEEGFFKSSNIGLYKEGVAIEKIGGSCAHSFVMAFEDELLAYKTWLKYYKNGTLLIDTYDVLEAGKMIVENNLETSCVRIDSEPLDRYAKDLRRYFDENGREDIKIFISGDLTPERLRDFEEKNIPFDLAMVGTKYVNIGLFKRINCGFVYKLVVNSIGNEKIYPEKKANGKSSYGGYKKVYVENGNIIVEKTEDNIGIIDSMQFGKNSAVILRGF